MARRPLIGITIDQHTKPDLYESPYTYARAIELAGGLPILLPFRCDVQLIHDYLDRLDGVLLSGGDDISPSLYGQALHAKAIPLDPNRQTFELALIAEIELRKLPVLGVCLGSQVLNVHRGGSLHQFLPDVPRMNLIEHRKIGEQIMRHAVTFSTGSLLGQAIGKQEISVNTYHKQAVDRIGRGLVVTSLAPDGVIESFEDPSYPLWVGVQWHPERLCDEAEHLAIFKLLVDRAAR